MDSSTAPRSARIMTFRELMELRPESLRGSCRFCQTWDQPGRYYSTRHFACAACCEKRGDEKLPKVTKAEKKACSIALSRVHMQTADAKFLAHIAAVSFDYASWAIGQAMAERAMKCPVACAATR